MEINIIQKAKQQSCILSIIIPVYNVEKYIIKCLESVVSNMENIDDDKVEVIIVNDGTPDNSMSIVNDYSFKFKRIIIINQQNQGLSVARNTGLAEAQGDYVWFVDSDDTLLPKALNQVMNAIISQPYIDVFASVLLLQNEKTGKTSIEYKPVEPVSTGREYMFKGNRLGASQRFIIRRNFLYNNGLKFMPGVYHEDGEFGLKVIYLAKHLHILDSPIYCYLLRSSGSIMSSRKPKMNTDLLLIYDELEKFANKNVLKTDYWRFMALAANCVYDTIFFSNKIIFTDDFRKFYNSNKAKIHKVALQMSTHPEAMSMKQYRTTLRMLFFPLLWTKMKQIIKKYIC